MTIIDSDWLKGRRKNA